MQLFGGEHCHPGYCFQAVPEQFLQLLVSLIPRYFTESWEIWAFFWETLGLHLARELQLVIALISRSSLWMRNIGIQEKSNIEKDLC